MKLQHHLSLAASSTKHEHNDRSAQSQSLRDMQCIHLAKHVTPNHLINSTILQKLSTIMYIFVDDDSHLETFAALLKIWSHYSSWTSPPVLHPHPKVEDSFSRKIEDSLDRWVAGRLVLLSSLGEHEHMQLYQKKSSAIGCGTYLCQMDLSRKWRS